MRTRRKHRDGDRTKRENGQSQRPLQRHPSWRISVCRSRAQIKQIILCRTIFRRDVFFRWSRVAHGTQHRAHSTAQNITTILCTAYSEGPTSDLPARFTYSAPPSQNQVSLCPSKSGVVAFKCRIFTPRELERSVWLAFSLSASLSKSVVQLGSGQAHQSSQRQTFPHNCP